jgi:uncharacterized protein YndB with AHSA1/START domain
MKALALALALAAAPAAAPPDDGISKLALVRIEVSSRIEAPASRVWSVLTGAKTAPSWCPLWTDPPLTPGPLDVVGRSIRFRDEFGNEGLSVVIRAAAPKELGIAHVPDNGSYLCQTTISLTAQGRRTSLRVIEQYSDQLDVPVDRDTATGTRDGIRRYVAELKRLAEGG